MSSTTNLDVTEQGSYEICYQVTDPSNNKSNKVCRTVITDITSVDKVTDGVNVNVYPNPTNGKFEVLVSLKEKAEVIVKITDILGKEVNSLNIGQVTEAKVPVDLSQVSAGVYFIQVVNGKSITSKKISVSK